MTVRGGGIGASGWLARITGPDPKWGVQRDFVNADRHLSGSGRSGSIHWEYECDGIYEYRNWAESSQRSTSGFFAVKHGEVADLGNRKVRVNTVAQPMADGARV